MENTITYKAQLIEPYISFDSIQNFQAQYGCGRVALCQEICRLKNISSKYFHLSDFELGSTSLSEIENQIGLMPTEDAVILDGIDSVNEQDLPYISTLILKWSLSHPLFLISFPNSSKIIQPLADRSKITLV